MSIRQTHTYVILELSQRAYEEIRDSLEKAGYQHAFHEDMDGRPVIDMQGLAVATERVPPPNDIFVNGKQLAFSQREISYEQIVALAYPDKKPWDGWTVVYIGKLPRLGGDVSGCIAPGKSVGVYDRMRFDVANTGNA